MTRGSPIRRLVAVSVVGLLAGTACGDGDAQLGAGNSDPVNIEEATTTSEDTTTTVETPTTTTVAPATTTTEAPQPLVVHRWQSGDPVSAPPEGLVITIGPPERTSLSAEGYITVTITVTNTSDEPIVLTSPHSQTVDAGLVRDGEWVGGFNYGVAAVVTQVEYSPGESSVEDVRVAARRGDEPLPPGQYVLAGGYIADGGFYLGSPLFRVTVTA